MGSTRGFAKHIERITGNAGGECGRARSSASLGWSAPRTKWLPNQAGIACRVAARTAGTPRRVCQATDGALRGCRRAELTRADTPSAQADAFDPRKALDLVSVMHEVAWPSLSSMN